MRSFFMRFLLPPSPLLPLYSLPVVGSTNEKIIRTRAGNVWCSGASFCSWCVSYMSLKCQSTSASFLPNAAALRYFHLVPFPYEHLYHRALANIQIRARSIWWTFPSGKTLQKIRIRWAHMGPFSLPFLSYSSEGLRVYTHLFLAAFAVLALPHSLPQTLSEW